MKELSIILLILNLTFGIFEEAKSQERGYGSPFHTFITMFSQANEAQIENISFPLLNIDGKDSSYIQKSQWKPIDYCFGCEYSSLLIEGNSVNDNSGYFKNIENEKYIISVYLKQEHCIKEFFFSKLGKTWNLNCIKAQDDFDRNSAMFFKFLERFSNDMEFVKQRITSDFIIETYDLEQAPIRKVKKTYEPIFFENQELLFSKIYLENRNIKGAELILYIKGEGTGYNTKYYFKKQNEEWYLSKLEDLGV